MGEIILILIFRMISDKLISRTSEILQKLSHPASSTKQKYYPIPGINSHLITSTFNISNLKMMYSFPQRIQIIIAIRRKSK
jgi:hypothetical protein